jgi:hypothetical protein
LCSRSAGFARQVSAASKCGDDHVDRLELVGVNAWTLVDGLLLTLWIGSEAVVNDLRIPFWRELARARYWSRQSRRRRLSTRLSRTSPPVEAEAVAAQRYRVPDRSLHRSEHLGRTRSSSASSCSR